MSTEIYTGPKVRCLDSFLRKAEFVHGATYDYSEVVYKDSKSKILINCRIHGPFYQTVADHLRGKNCRECSYEGRGAFSTDTFLLRARNVHGNKYGYSKAKYFNSQSMVEIICPAHGVFVQKAASHIKGKGCSKCYSDSRRLDTEEFVKKAIGVHGDKYDYSNVVYSTSRAKVEITCIDHGSFFQKPNNHLNGQGCPKCKLIGCYNQTIVNRNPDKPTTLYLIKFFGNGECFLKVGLTSNLETRINSFPKQYSIEILRKFDTTLAKAFHTEQSILRDNQSYSPRIKFCGYTECFIPTPSGPVPQPIQSNRIASTGYESARWV